MNTVPARAVVVGIDGSGESENALDWAADRAADTHRPLHILHARATETDLPPWATGHFTAPPDLCEQAAGRAISRRAGLTVTCARTDDQPTPALVSASRTADEIVLGSRGFGAVRSTILGSVSVRVTAQAECPVVIVRPLGSPGQVDGPVLVGVDGRPGGEAALGFAFEEADRRGVGLVAVHCWEFDPPSYAAGLPILGLDRTEAARESQQLLNEALSGPSAHHPGVKVESHLDRSAVVESLARRSGEACLVVVGTRGHHARAGMFLGGVSRGMMHRAHCPVVVVPPRTRAAAGASSDRVNPADRRPRHG